MINKTTVITIGSIIGAIACAWLYAADKRPALPIDSLPADLNIAQVPAGFDSLPKSPPNNPMTLAKAKLGRRLFFDPILSGDGSVSCASCHQPEHGFASPDRQAVGIHGRPARRHAPTLINRGYGQHFSWDGRNLTLEDQISGPINDENEMGSSVAEVLFRLRNETSYQSQFHGVFSEATSDDPATETITQENLEFAIACFERTLVSGNSPVDQFRAQNYSALSQSARQGLWLFEGRGGCWKCHSGANFTDEQFHNTGIGHGQADRDPGRFEYSKNEKHKFQFKTPTLREVEHTAPYMHDGSQGTLRDVVEFYNRGGNRADPEVDEKLIPLHLSGEEIGFLVDFLKGLSGESF